MNYGSAACFVPASGPLLCSQRGGVFTGRCVLSAKSPLVGVKVHTSRRPRLSMGLFGLGLPEIAVIAGIGILIFGPSKIAELGKDLGGVAGSVKKATSEFQDAMQESLAEADREIEKKKLAKTKSSQDDAKSAASAEDDNDVEKS